MDDSSYVLTLYSKYMEQCLTKFMTSDNKTFVQAAQETLDNTISSRNVDAFIADIFPVAISTFTKMALVYQSEIFKSLKLDESLPDRKEELKEIKKKVNLQNKTIGYSQLYKMIREAMVHTDTDHPNFQFVRPGEFSLKLKPKGQPEIQLFLSDEEMRTIISVFNFNLGGYMYNFTERPDLQKAVDRKSLNERNLNEYLKLEWNGKPVKLDIHQKEAFLNYFYSNNEILNYVYSTGAANSAFFMSRIPFQANEYNNFIACLRAGTYLRCLKENVNMTFLQFEQYFYDFLKINKVPMQEGVIVDPYVDVVYNLLISTFGNMATTVSKDDFCDILKRGGCKMDESAANHIRNSIAHGRFFINHKDDATVEFYDGRNADDLTHIVSFPIGKLNKVLVKQIMAYDAQLNGEEQEPAR